MTDQQFSSLAVLVQEASPCHLGSWEGAGAGVEWLLRDNSTAYCITVTLEQVCVCGCVRACVRVCLWVGRWACVRAYVC